MKPEQQGISVSRVLQNRAAKICRLTDSPQRHPQILVGIKLSGKLIAVIEDAHKAKKMFCGNGVVDFVVLQELVSRFDQKKLENAFDNNLLEYASAIRQGQLARRPINLCFRIHRSQKRRCNQIGRA